MKVTIQGGSDVTLNDNDYVAEGGEGKIYRKGKKVFKIYTKKDRVIPVDKMVELSTLDRNTIIRPKKFVLNKKGDYIGFIMDFVDSSIPLCKLFTNAFRKTNTVDQKSILELIQEMKSTIDFIHEKDCLMVDGNEMNYLVDENNFQTPFFIDVDSWQTPSYPATAIMPSIKDHHSKGFSKLTDWYAFAVVSCQLLIGLHPYKGKHPDFPKRDMEIRMKANVSIFNSKTTVPSATRDFSLIPSSYKDWYMELFEKGNRFPAPATFGEFKPIAVAVKMISGTDNFETTLIQKLEEEILKHVSYFGQDLTITKTSVSVNKKSVTTPHFVKSQHAIVSKDSLKVVVPYLTPMTITSKKVDVVSVWDSTNNTSVNTHIGAEKLFVFDNIPYVLNENKFCKISIQEIGNKVFVSVEKTLEILPNSTMVLDGFLFSDVLGKAFFTVPYNEGKSFAVTAIPELNGYRILDGKKSSSVLIAYGYKNKRHDKIILKFNESFQTYSCTIVENVSQPSFNFVCLDNGIAIHIDEKDNLGIFFANPTNTSKKIISDPFITSDMTLCNRGKQTRFFIGKELWSLKMK